MAFTILDGAQFFATFFVNLFRHRLYVDGHYIYAANFYANQTLIFCYYFMPLQTWIFAMNYLESAMIFSFS